MLVNLTKRNEVKNLRTIIILVVMMFVMTGMFAIRHASQVAHQNELNSQLIHEQQKVQESERQLAALKAQVNSQGAIIKMKDEYLRELTNANEELKNQNIALTNENEELTKKYKELVKP